jgi:predicted SAM-dependent methyltransferase
VLLNLGSGAKKKAGYVNVDKYGEPDLKWDLESFPWPWETSSVDHVLLHHVLEHLGRDTDTFLKIIQELYRVCKGGASIEVIVPHPRHDFYLGDPTHVRPIMPATFSLFSKKYCELFKGSANTPLAYYLDVNFDIGDTFVVPDDAVKDRTIEEINAMEKRYNNIVQEYQIHLKVVK